MTGGISGLVLAGGGSTRLGGGDKTLLDLGGAPILSAIVGRLQPQVAAMAISANGDPARFGAYGVPVLADDGTPAGPLSGVLAGMQWAANRTGSSHVLTVAGDTPFFPADLCLRLRVAREENPDRVAIAASGGRIHPVFALWPVGLAAMLARFLKESKTFKVNAFFETLDLVTVDFPFLATAQGNIDPFFNVNTPADLAEAQAIHRSLNP